ncbi:MAG: hypothetical protein P1Q69_00625 [Candidatus Thorarchaeota archaeon]|nr:hypothetical protein [Candidatus Thorarchaeota archaeon]
MPKNDVRKIAKVARETGDLRTTLAVIRTIEAEKRTHLAELRTGIGILTIPMSLLTILTATSEYYMIDQVLTFIVGLIIGIIGLSIVGSYLVVRALLKLRASDELRQDTCDDTDDLMKNHENTRH